jgi:hypothetical protein
MRIGTILVCVGAILSFSAAVRGAVDHAPFTNLLRDNVTDDGRVDYAALKASSSTCWSTSMRWPMPMSIP